MSVKIKKQVLLAGGIILIAITSCLLLNDKNKIGYTLQKFEQNEVCNRRMNMYYGEADQIRLGMEEDIYIEEKANKYLKKIEDDIKLIDEKFKGLSNQMIKIYIIQKPLDNSVYVGKNVIYCTEEEIENNTYRAGLVRACYDLTDPAVIHGLEGYIFGEDVNIENLREYYSETEDISILGLFGARFYEEWNTKEEIKIVRETATALMSYFIKQDRAELILNQKVGLDEKREWLQSIGVSRIYENPYEDRLSSLTFSKSKDYSLIISSNEANYYMNIIKYLSTAKEVETFIYKDYDGRKYILNYLEQKAPNNFKYILKQIKPEYFFATAYPTLGGHTTASGKITLGAPLAHLHEYTHVLTGFSDEARLWMQEGLADYLSRVIYPKNYIIQADFSGITPETLPNSPDHYAKAMAYYKAHGGKFSHENIDAKLYADACAYGVFNSIENLPSDSQSIGKGYGVRDQYKENGNELTYSQASSFTGYLIDNFSLDTYLGYYIGDKTTESFEEAFGLTYEEVKQEWLDYLYREN